MLVEAWVFQSAK